jgi:regulator of nucleoside diphosphate kinase
MMASRIHRKPVACVSALDKSRLESLIERSSGAEPADDRSAEKILRRLRSAELVVPPEDVPRDLVTMNSTVRLVDPIACEQWEVTLVYPEDHEPEKSHWSILSPVGSALFGLRIYDAADVKRGDRPGEGWVVAEIPFQPERRGWMSL